MEKVLDLVMDRILTQVWDNTALWRWLALILIAEFIAIFTRKDLFKRWIFQDRFYAHDLSKFKESDSIMDEKFFKEYISTLHHSNAMDLSVGHKIDDWCEFIRRSENEYLMPDIRFKAEAFYRSLVDLSQYVVKHFFTRQKGSLDRVFLYPDLDHTNEERLRYAKHEKELQILLQKALSMHKEYRSAVKNSLYI